MRAYFKDSEYESWKGIVYSNDYSSGQLELQSGAPLSIGLRVDRGWASSYDVVIRKFSVESKSDTDSDGLLDDEESLIGSDPDLADTDGDGVIDWLDEDPLDRMLSKNFSKQSLYHLFPNPSLTGTKVALIPGTPKLAVIFVNDAAEDVVARQIFVNPEDPTIHDLTVTIPGRSRIIRSIPFTAYLQPQNDNVTLNGLIQTSQASLTKQFLLEAHELWCYGYYNFVPETAQRMGLASVHKWVKFASSSGKDLGLVTLGLFEGNANITLRWSNHVVFGTSYQAKLKLVVLDKDTSLAGFDEQGSKTCSIFSICVLCTRT